VIDEQLPEVGRAADLAAITESQRARWAAVTGGAA
jgi:hypothetical protein